MSAIKDGENASADCSKLRKTPAGRRVTRQTCDGAVEQWIDGPCSIPDVQTALITTTVGGENSEDATEMWVDGPAEFQKDPNSLIESHKSPMKLGKSKCAKLYRARAAALAAAATNADDANGDARALGGCGEGLRADADISDLIGIGSIAAGRQIGVDARQTRHKAGTRDVLGADLTTATTTEELSRSRGHRRLSGRKQTDHITLASFYSPDSCPASAQSSPARGRLRVAGGQTTAAIRGGVRCGDRTAQWVRSVQVVTAAAAAGITQPPSAQFTRPRSPLKSHSVDRVLRGCGHDVLGGLRAWQDDSASDDAVTAVSNNSPPPDYATCVAADLERRRRHSRRLSSPTTNLDINENLQATGTSALAQKLLPISLTSAYVAGWSSPYSYGVEAANNHETTSGCQQPEKAFDTSTWPRRQDGGSLSFAAVDVDDEVTNSLCKRLHHPDGASNPQLSEEVLRSDVTDCCKLLTLLNGDADTSMTPPTSTPTSFPLSSTCHQCCHADRTDILKCRNSGHAATESHETSSALSPDCTRIAIEDFTNGSNSPTPAGASENPSNSKQSCGTIAPTSNLSQTTPSTRLKAASSSSKTASPKRSKSSSGMSLLWCIHHPRSSKSRSSKSDQQIESMLPYGESSADRRRQQPSTPVVDVQRLASDSAVGDSDRGSSVSETTSPTALDLARRLYNVDDDSSSDYWSAKVSADHLSSSIQPIAVISNVHQRTDGEFTFLELHLSHTA